MCVRAAREISHLYPATCRDPNGSRQRPLFSTNFPQIPSPSNIVVVVGSPDLLPPIPLEKEAKRNNRDTPKDSLSLPRCGGGDGSLDPGFPAGLPFPRAHICVCEVGAAVVDTLGHGVALAYRRGTCVYRCDAPTHTACSEPLGCSGPHLPQRPR